MAISRRPTVNPFFAVLLAAIGVCRAAFAAARLLSIAGGMRMLELLENQQKLTLNQKKIVFAAIVGDMLDFFDYYLIGFVLAFIVVPWKLTYGQSAMVLLSSGIGAIPGAMFWGWMADRIGRRKVFIYTILNFSLATGVLALTPENGAGWIFLTVFRFVNSWSC